jgi:hypothetical protein
MNKKLAIVKKLDKDEADVRLMLENAQTVKQKEELSSTLDKIESARNRILTELGQ